jgi:RNA polymerase sigma factor (sigma-70 family)
MEARKRDPSRQVCDPLVTAEILGDLPDGGLLEIFTGRGRAEAERAFAVLVRRHGATVLRVCRRVLRDEQEAEDAFQVTFLILAKKARGLRIEGSLAPWLHAVACRVASDARKAAARRQARHQRMKNMASASPRGTSPATDESEQAAILHEEIGRLSEALREAVVLCDLHGLSHHKAAQLLGWPVGTVKSRQSRARERLRQRLALRGLAFTVAGLAAWSQAEGANLDVAPGLVDGTARAAVEYAAGGGVTAAAPEIIERATRASMRLAIARLGAVAAMTVPLIAAAAAAAFIGGRALVGVATADGGPSGPRRSGSIPYSSLANRRWTTQGLDAPSPGPSRITSRPPEEILQQRRGRASAKPARPKS